MNFIKCGIDKDLDAKLYTVLESDAKLEACRKYFNELISVYEDSNKTRFNKKYKDDKNDYVKINETEKNNFSLIATDRRCKILEEVLKNTNLNVANLKYTVNNIENTFNLEIGKGILEFPKHTASNKFITSKQINQLCKNVSLLKSELMNVINQVYMQIVESLMDYQQHFDLIGEFITLLDVIFTKAIISFLIVGIITKFENVVFIKFILNANENISCVMISISLAESCLPLFPTVFSITVFSLSF
jgi:hypothetical protein